MVLVFCNKLLLTSIIVVRLVFGDMAECPRKTLQKLVTDHQRHPVLDLQRKYLPQMLSDTYRHKSD